MSDHKFFIGQIAGPFLEEPTPEKLVQFERAVGWTGIARAAPTFVTRCRSGEFELMSKMGIELSQILHAEQEYVYERELDHKQTWIYSTVLDHVAQKNGASGEMSFLTFKTNIREKGFPENDVACIAKTLIVFRKRAQT